jgi:arabinose-5-phosphate isomerase
MKSARTIALLAAGDELLLGNLRSHSGGSAGREDWRIIVPLFKEPLSDMAEFDFIQAGLRVIQVEQTALDNLRPHIDARFQKACELMLACSGRIVVTGMGKSGHIGNKIAATLASTGSPAFFVHPGEASHGDLGMITPQDVVIAISNSGETGELLAIVPLIKRMHAPLISITNNSHSSLSQAATVSLEIGKSAEACPLGLAPTSSTTATLVLGDALAVALLEARGFTAEDFALSHPGGSLGRKLLLRVQDVMHKDEQVPVVTDRHPDSLTPCWKSRKQGLGHDRRGRCSTAHWTGLYTDGDLRRCLDHGILTSISTAYPRRDECPAEMHHRDRQPAGGGSRGNVMQATQDQRGDRGGSGRQSPGRRPQHARPAACGSGVIMLIPYELPKKPAGIRLLALDVDGVLTDGRLYFHRRRPGAEDLRLRRTATASSCCSKPGVTCAIITGRTSQTGGAPRYATWALPMLLQGREDKLVALRELAGELGMALGHIAYVGDDWPDLPAIRAAGLGIAVANAHGELHTHADYVTRLAGGRGAVREVCDLLLKAQGQYDRALAPYLEH